MLPALDGGTYPQGNFDTVSSRAELHCGRQRGLGGDTQGLRGCCAPAISPPTAQTRTSWRSRSLRSEDRQSRRSGCAQLVSARGQFQTDLSNEVSRVDRLSRVNAQADVTYFGSLAGPHMLKAGVQFDRRANGVDGGRAPTASTCSGTPAWRPGGRYGTYRVFSNPIDPKRGSISRSATFTTRPSACSCRTRGRCPAG